jgi:hypothetical protein
VPPDVVELDTDVVICIRWLALERHVRHLDIAELFETVSKGRSEPLHLA